jgi:hypothetical protein
MKVTFAGLIIIGSLDLGAFLGGLALNYWADLGRWPLAVALGVIAICTFMGLLLSGNKSSAGVITIADGELRTAAASTLVILYALSYAIFSLNDYNPDDGSLSRVVIDQFGSVVLLVLGFYFGSTAAIEIFGRPSTRRDAEQEHPRDESEGA